MPNADGPDTSHWNTYTGRPFPVSWRLHAIKCSEGGRSGDETFRQRWAFLRALKVQYRGAYHFLRSDSTVEAQAQNLCGRLDAVGGLLRGEFVQIDWETIDGITVATSGMAAELADRVEQHYGRSCTITYSSDWLPDSKLDSDYIREFFEWRQENPTRPLWYANYDTTPNGDGTDGPAECARYGAAIWQWTAHYRSSAISGDHDMNHVIDWSVLDRLTNQEEEMSAVRPQRQINTTIGQGGGRLSAGIDAEFTLPALPPTATQCTINVGVVNPTAPGWLTVWADGGWPGTASVNYMGGPGAESNLVLTQVLAGGRIRVRSSQACDLVVDLQGYS